MRRQRGFSLERGLGKPRAGGLGLTRLERIAQCHHIPRLHLRPRPGPSIRSVSGQSFLLLQRLLAEGLICNNISRLSNYDVYVFLNSKVDEIRAVIKKLKITNSGFNSILNFIRSFSFRLTHTNMNDLLNVCSASSFTERDLRALLGFIQSDV